jgi:hypothetical protein
MVPDAATEAYLQRALSLASANDANGLAKLRSARRGSPAASTVPDRTRAQAILDDLGRRYGEVTVDEVRRAAGDADVRAFADLTQQFARFERVVRLRESFDRASSDREMPARFITGYKAIALNGPAVRIALKTRALSAMADPDARAELRTGATLLRKRFKGIYSLEREWLDSIVGYSGGSPYERSRLSRTRDWMSDSPWSRLVYWFVIVNAMRLIAQLFGHK